MKAPFVMTDCYLDVFPSVLPAALFPVSQELTCTEDTGVMCCNSFVHPREASRGLTKKNRNIHSLYPFLEGLPNSARKEPDYKVPFSCVLFTIL